MFTEIYTLMNTVLWFVLYTVQYTVLYTVLCPYCTIFCTLYYTLSCALYCTSYCSLYISIQDLGKLQSNNQNRANWYYLAQLVGSGGICFGVGEKWENNVAYFYMAHDCVHFWSKVALSFFSNSVFVPREKNLVHFRDLLDPLKKVKHSLLAKKVLSAVDITRVQ